MKIDIKFLYTKDIFLLKHWKDILSFSVACNLYLENKIMYMRKLKEQYMINNLQSILLALFLKVTYQSLYISQSVINILIINLCN